MKLMIAPLLILPTAFGQTALTIAQIAKKVSPSVVGIEGKTDSREVLGSGFIISKDGKIVTNLHVIRELKTAIVHLANGEAYDSVSVLATDERRDVAVVKIAGFDLPILDFGNSDALTIGDQVVIVGSPRGLERAVTAGILSSVRDSGEGFKALQTDAAVSPGDSGGPLVNNKGQAIGVISYNRRSAEGLNLALPANYVRGMLNNLHEPMTLEQMRRTIKGQDDRQNAGPLTDNTVSPETTGGGPSLKETLDWLKQTLPLAATHYTYESKNAVVKDVTLRTLPAHFESCTVSFDWIETGVFSNAPDVPVVSSSRQTLPLGALAGGDLPRGTPKTGQSGTPQNRPVVDRHPGH